MISKRKEVAPSLLSADFTNLGEAVRMVAEGGAGIVHLDVMDGHFVPNLTIGPPVIRALRQITPLLLDVHLMIENADETVHDYIDAGADMISVHVEASRHLHRTLTRIAAAGRHPGVVLNPATPISIIDEALDLVDFVLLMSVNPGFGGQTFIPTAFRKVEQLAREIHRRRLDVAIQLDGGVDLDNIAALSQAGVDIAVAGSAVFNSDDPVKTIQQMLKRML
ncbi:MAG: ribulose-phosphate 3-epimerase [Acidobacteria bacterium]|nr:ribulose-phosphate 3-epimerase [Acidobacteriota bacterium]